MGVYLLGRDLRCLDRLEVWLGLRLISKLLDVLSDWKRRNNRDLTFPQAILLEDHRISNLRFVNLLWIVNDLFLICVWQCIYRLNQGH